MLIEVFSKVVLLPPKTQKITIYCTALLSRYRLTQTPYKVLHIIKIYPYFTK